MESFNPSPLSVLVLDDDESILRLLKIFLNQQGYKVSTAKDGQTGLRMLMTHGFDLLIVDVQMPKLDGLSFAREARSMWPWLRMIFCTGYYNREVKRVAAEVGITEILKKPLSFNTLEQAIQNCFPDKRADSPLITHTREERTYAMLHRLRAFSREQSNPVRIQPLLQATCDLLMELIPCERAAVYFRDEEAAYCSIRSRPPCSRSNIERILSEIRRKFEVMGEGSRFSQPPPDVRVDRSDLREAGNLPILMMPIPHPKQVTGFLHLDLAPGTGLPSPSQSTLLCVAHHLALLLDQIEQIRTHCGQDPLTGLMNREWLAAQVEKLWKYRDQEGISPALLIVDVDDLKSVNDAHGMAEGDQVLLRLTACLEPLIVPGVELARMGGDTFGLLFQSATPEAVDAMAGRINEAWKQLKQKKESDTFTSLTISMGYALMMGEQVHSGLELIECAEQALQTTKREGGGKSLSWTALCESDNLNYDQHSVLVVDDDPQVVHLIRRMLNPNMYRVTGATTVAEAMQLLEEGNKFHLLLTDIALPHQDGTVMMELAARIDPELVMVVISGQLSDDSDSKLRGLGAFEIIQKPFNIQRVRQVVNAALETRSRSLRQARKDASASPDTGSPS